MTNSLFFGFHFILTYEFMKPSRTEIFTLKIHSIQGISIQQDSFMYYIKLITTTTSPAVHKKAARSLTFFSFLTFIWCLFWLLFYMAQNLRKKYISLCRRKMRENARTRLVPVNTEHLKANKFFFNESSNNSRRDMETLLGFSSVFLLPFISNNWKNYKGGALLLFNCWIWGAV